MNQTMEQKRAAHAWKCATEAKARLGNDYKDYVNAAKGLPALIMNSGLMQVMAFLHGKKETRCYDVLSGNLRDWLNSTLQTPAKFEDFMQHLLQAEPREFQAITTEAFAWLRWLRQMAQAVKKGGD